MPRTARIAPGGVVFHVLNRGALRQTLFRSHKDYLAFMAALRETLAAMPTMRLLAFCLMPNHWHLVLWPAADGNLARFMMRLTITHVRRWVEYHHRVGGGHVYQGRYKSFAAQDDDHLANLMRYVERNALRAKLARRAELWRYSSLGQDRQLTADERVPLAAWPIPRRRDWLEWVNQPQTAAESAAIQRCITQGRPYGSERWIRQTMATLGWRDPLPRGRPRKRRK